uniref:Putative reverse transcriptase domain-containing protein n=1 Tax=Tanacetum cinerariifolium TaxID=118510 RepID=A0A6L2P5P6_TANCI|nr:putative reverse transcriptase domain-containing protein [Tanacetum cinerariifolium]
MVKMPLVDLKVLEDESFRMCIDFRELSKIYLYSDCHQIRVHEDEIPKAAFRMRYGRYEFTVIPFRATKEREVSCEAQQGQSEVKRKLFGSCRKNIEGLNMRQRRWMELFSEYGCEIKYLMGKQEDVSGNGLRRPKHASTEMLRGLDQRIEKRDGDEAVARHEVHVSSIPDRDGMYIEVLARNVEVVRNTSRYEYCLPSID